MKFKAEFVHAATPKYPSCAVSSPDKGNRRLKGRLSQGRLRAYLHGGVTTYEVAVARASLWAIKRARYPLAVAGKRRTRTKGMGY